MKIRPSGPLEAEVFYDLDLGLPAESFGIPFGHVCAGVFLETLNVVALASGYRVHENLEHSEMDFEGSSRLHLIASIQLLPVELDAEGKSRAERGLQLIRSRRTSRRPYQSRSINQQSLLTIEKVCAQTGYTFRHTSDRTLVRRIVHINQATLFDDLENDAVYTEIMQWLRFSKVEAKTKGDGLSAEAMLMPGPVLRFAMSRRGLWKAPILGALIRRIYLNTMRGVHELGWIEGPFAGPRDYITAGRTFMRAWLELHRHGVVIHPFGTVITNPRSHEQFARAVNAEEGQGNMAWMLFRMGFSAYPPEAHRRPVQSMLISADSSGENQL